MGYADLDSAKVQLQLDDENPDDAEDIALLAGIDEEISRTFELKTGRTWGGTATPSARTIDGPDGISTDILLLPSPVRSIDSIAIVGSSPESVSSDDYVLWHVSRDGDAHAIRRIQNGWWPMRNGVDRVTVTAVWSDEANGDDVPQEVVDAVTFIAVETFRQRKTSPTGEIGPDGFTIRPRNPWGFEVVKEAIKRHAAGQPIVSF